MFVVATDFPFGRCSKFFVSKFFPPANTFLFRGQSSGRKKERPDRQLGGRKRKLSEKQKEE